MSIHEVLSKSAGSPNNCVGNEIRKQTRMPFIISIARNKMKANLMMVVDPDKEIPDISSEMIVQHLGTKGIVHGIRHDAIDKFIADQNFMKDIIVAQGEIPVQGDDACFDSNINLNKCSKSEFEAIKKSDGKKKQRSGANVKKDTVLMTKTPATIGKPGTDITGRQVKAIPGRDEEFKFGENVKLSEDGLSLVACVDGVAVSVDGEINVVELKKEQVEFFVSPDELTAKLVLTPGDSEKVQTGVEEIKKLLKEAGIKYGIRKDLERLLPKKIVSKIELDIARGLEPIKGRDGALKIIDPCEESDEVAYKEDESGNVDFREKIDTGIVRKGTIVATLVPPTSGRDGITVTGGQIPAEAGKPGKIIAGRNIVLDEKGESAIAMTDGKLVVSGSNVSVDELLVIDGNVDYNTGNLTFDGAVIVKGDLLPGFYVSASGDVEIHGVVDGGNVSSDSNIIIRGAVLGAGKSRIKARCDITVKSADQAELEAGGCLFADHFLRNCNIRVNEDLAVTHKTKGHILGGKTVVGGSIESFSIGNVSYTPTMIEIGASPETMKKYDEYKNEIKRIDVQIKKIEPSIRTLQKQHQSGKLPADRQKLFRNLLNACLNLKNKQVQLETQKEAIEERLALTSSARVTVRGKAYTGVKIRIGIAVLSIAEEIERSVFREKDERIITEHF